MNYEKHNDVTLLVRSLFVDRCPLLCRLPWARLDRNDFTMGGPGPEGGSQWSQEFRSQFHAGRPRPIHSMDDTEREIHRLLYENKAIDGESIHRLRLMAGEIERSFYTQHGGPWGMDGPSSRMSGLISDIIRTNRKAINHDDLEDKMIRGSVLGVCFDRVREHGGDPDLMLVSSDFRAGGIFKSWGWIVERVLAGVTVLGKPIWILYPTLWDNKKGYGGPALPTTTLIEAPLLPPRTVVTLATSEVRVRNRVNPHWRPTVDSGAGGFCWLAEMSIDVADESHCGCVTTT